jgi:hypothetical protein
MNFWYECLLFIRFELVDFDWALTSLRLPGFAVFLVSSRHRAA